MPVSAGEYIEVKANRAMKWSQVQGEPKGVEEALLRKQSDGSYTHLLRIATGVEFPEPVTHEFYEEAYYIDGEMYNAGTGKTIKGGTYVFHEPGEPHGPFRCMKTCLLLEFRYYK